MKVCLISAPTANEFDDPEIVESDAMRMIAEHAPLGILSLAAVLEQNGAAPEIVDLNRLYYEYLRADDTLRTGVDFTAYAASHLETLSLDFYGFSTICSSYPLTLRVARELKRLRPETVIALGGPQASVVDVQTMKAFPFIDVVVRGEAENTLPALLDGLSSKSLLSALAGITFRRGAEIVRTNNAPPIEDLDCLPMPAYHLYPYMQGCQYVALELGRGCPFACSFCSTNDFFRRRFRLKSPDRVIGEMRSIKEKYHVESFDLVHDMFTVDRKKVIDFCNAIIESGESFCWGCSARTDCIDEDMIKLMSRAGCQGIFFGIETGSARLQKIIKKGLDLSEAATMVKCNDKYKIETAVSLITGFPEETMDDLKDTVHFFMDSLRFDYADPQLCLLAPLAETPIETEHRGALIFDDIISDMSFQGWQQDPLDREMIAEHPDIFPNFYSVPTPHLDRQFLKELREFLLNGMAGLRWLLVGLHQDSGDLMKVFAAWREWRELNKGPYPNGNATSYYAGCSFSGEFIEFVRSKYLPTSAKAQLAITSLVDYEESLEATLRNPEKQASKSEQDEIKDCGGLVTSERVPVLKPHVALTVLGANYNKTIKCLRRKGRLGRIPADQVTVATRQTPDKRLEILQLSELSTELLRLCDGNRTVSEIADEFYLYAQEIDGVPGRKASILGLELLRQQGLLALTNGPALLPEQVRSESFAYQQE